MLRPLQRTSHQGIRPIRTGLIPLSDPVIAFLLPLLTALAGMWLFRFLFPALGGQMPLLEQLACGLGLGMMAVAAAHPGHQTVRFPWVPPGVPRACGGRHCGNLARPQESIGPGWRTACRKTGSVVPSLIAILVAGSLVFLVLFRLAGLQGLVDYDAVIGWLLKAKIIHLYAGNEMVQWFSNPRLAHAHLDYPTLVPSLHAATYDSTRSCGRICHQVLARLDAVLSCGRPGVIEPEPERWFYAPYFGLLGLLLLPATQKYVQMEGGTMPMIFFTVMGFVQCAFWLVGKDPARLGLGLTLLFGAAMTKFEGFIFLALVGGWLLLLPSARPSLQAIAALLAGDGVLVSGGPALRLSAHSDTRS